MVLASPGAREENLYVAGERLAARAASPATRRQYASIYRTFGDWLRGQLARPPVTSDLTGDAIAAFGRPGREDCGQPAGWLVEAIGGARLLRRRRSRRWAPT